MLLKKSPDSFSFDKNAQNILPDDLFCAQRHSESSRPTFTLELTLSFKAQAQVRYRGQGRL